MIERIATGLCDRCGAPDSPILFGMLMHGHTFRCQRCQVEKQLTHAREQAARIYDLQALLIELGGPAEKIYCGTSRSYQHSGYCWLELDHEGKCFTKKKTK